MFVFVSRAVGPLFVSLSVCLSAAPPVPELVCLPLTVSVLVSRSLFAHSVFLSAPLSAVLVAVVVPVLVLAALVLSFSARQHRPEQTPVARWLLLVALAVSLLCLLPSCPGQPC